MIKVTLVCAPVSSELPLCETVSFSKQLISPTLFNLSKAAKRTMFNIVVVAIERNFSRNVSVKAGVAHLFSKIYFGFRNWMYLKTIGKMFGFLSLYL